MTQVTQFMRVDLTEVEPGVIHGRADRAEHLTKPDGAMRVGPLLTMLDYAGGLCGGLASLPDGWVVSTNLAARFVAPARHGPFRIEASVLRVGRNNVVTAVALYDEGADDALVASGVLTSAVLVPENGPPQWERPLRLVNLTPSGPQPDLTEWLRLRAIDGGVEIPLDDRFRNPWGILHGGVVATIVDLAAGGNTTDVVLHFLAPNRIGPVQAIATPVGERSDGTVQRVEVRDIGADRVTAVAIVTSL
ncbi:MAG: PaaI family thioesterase [Actinomycetota bacterium]|nr:PaaI family thioesterase [Actinomycetota bacterium]